MYADDMRVFKVDDGETHWVVAEDVEDAIADVAAAFDFEVQRYREEMEPGCEAVFHSDLVEVDYRNDGGEIVAKSARDWAIEKRGVFCSTAWD